MSRALGRYELLRPLARGGMAEVFLARRRAAGVEKWLVVKRMRPERVGDARFLDLFVREARLSMSLVHQNIVPVFDFGRIDDQVFLAMERVEGKDLGSSLARAGKDHPLPALLAAFVAAECCQALDYAHRRRGPDGALLGIVHRDVTPRNVLLSWSGEVKLTDFGIAALAGDSARSVIGTPAYMAPEQARGEPADPRADVYAIGLVLREALTGVRPRAGDDRDATLAAARSGELAAWPDVEVDPRLRAIVDRATSIDREARFPDARAMLEELDQLIVTQRSEKKGNSPTRQLAGWLADVWKSQSEETTPDASIPGEHLVSFLDDGELDVIGTGTIKSMALTAADAPEPPKPEPPPAPPARKKAGVWWVPILPIAVTGLVVLVFATGKDTRPPPPDAASPVAATVTDAATVTATVTDAATATVTVTATVTDAAVSRPPHPATVSRAPHPVPATVPRDAAPAVAPAPLYSFTINVTPWAFFTVDSDPTRHQTPDTLKLAAGLHHVHFWNDVSGAQRDVTIEVPARNDATWAGKLSD